MVFNMVDDLGNDDQAGGFTALAQWLAGKLMAAQATPFAMVVAAASSVTALSAALAVQTGEGI